MRSSDEAVGIFEPFPVDRNEGRVPDLMVTFLCVFRKFLYKIVFSMLNDFQEPHPCRDADYTPVRNPWLIWTEIQAVSLKMHALRSSAGEGSSFQFRMAQLLLTRRCS